MKNIIKKFFHSYIRQSLCKFLPAFDVSIAEGKINLTENSNREVTISKLYSCNGKTKKNLILDAALVVYAFIGNTYNLKNKIGKMKEGSLVKLDTSYGDYFPFIIADNKFMLFKSEAIGLCVKTKNNQRAALVKENVFKGVKNKKHVNKTQASSFISKDEKEAMCIYGSTLLSVRQIMNLKLNQKIILDQLFEEPDILISNKKEVRKGYVRHYQGKYAMELLKGSFSENELKNMKELLKDEEIENFPLIEEINFDFINSIQPKELASLLSSEPVEVIALIVNKMEDEYKAEFLSELDNNAVRLINKQNAVNQNVSLTALSIIQKTLKSKIKNYH